MIDLDFLETVEMIMYATHSPLRYPGGKAAIINDLIEIIKYNKFQLCSYVEPFAGGCGLALGLLMRGYVSRIYINDIDIGIYSFWHSILNRNEDFLVKILNTEVTIEEWYRQRDIIRAADKSGTFDLGFATFFMNRTNRSGIISAGVIGGLKQNGNYLIDCRFNKNDLISRIRRIGIYKDKIHLSSLEALNFLDSMECIDNNILYYIDPPYYKKGSSLYTEFYKHKDHEILSNRIANLKKPWILTYDNEIEIIKLYSQFRSLEFKLNYSVRNKCIGTELMFFSDDILIPIHLQKAA